MPNVRRKGNLAQNLHGGSGTEKASRIYLGGKKLRLRGVLTEKELQALGGRGRNWGWEKDRLIDQKKPRDLNPRSPT